MNALRARVTIAVAAAGFWIPAMAAAQPVQASQSITGQAIAGRLGDGPAPIIDARGPLARAAWHEASRAVAAGVEGTVDQPASERRGWVARHPVLAASLAGTAAGAAIGLAVSDPDCKKPSRTCTMRGEAVPFLAILGAGMGALTGLVVDAVRK